MLDIFFIVLLAFVGFWAYKHRKQVKAWFKKVETPAPAPASNSTTGTPPAVTSAAPTPPPNAPPAP